MRDVERRIQRLEERLEGRLGCGSCTCPEFPYAPVFVMVRRPLSDHELEALKPPPCVEHGHPAYFKIFLITGGSVEGRHDA